LSRHCTYLQHESITIEGIKIFGSPYTLKHSDSAFQYIPSEGEKLWSAIPTDTDILVTHEPPHGTMDTVRKLLVFSENIGCKHLAERVRTINPKLHVFGHVHDSTGIIVSTAGSSQSTKIKVNAAQYVSNDKPLKNRPFFFELTL